MSAFAYDQQNDSQENDEINECKLVIGIYFDGTHNNRYNVEARERFEEENSLSTTSIATKEEEKAYKKHKKDNSYVNHKTNVDLAEANAAKKMETIYIEGIATEKHEGDEGLGAGSLGDGAKGIRGRVHDACKVLAGKVTKEVTEVVLDVFGFSRGAAAAARNFVFEITREEGIGELNTLKQIDEQKYFS